MIAYVIPTIYDVHFRGHHLETKDNVEEHYIENGNDMEESSSSHVRNF